MSLKGFKVKSVINKSIPDFVYDDVNTSNTFTIDLGSLVNPNSLFLLNFLSFNLGIDGSENFNFEIVVSSKLSKNNNESFIENILHGDNNRTEVGGGGGVNFMLRRNADQIQILDFATGVFLLPINNIFSTEFEIMINVWGISTHAIRSTTNLQFLEVEPTRIAHILEDDSIQF